MVFPWHFVQQLAHSHIVWRHPQQLCLWSRRGFASPQSALSSFYCSAHRARGNFRYVLTVVCKYHLHYLGPYIIITYRPSSMFIVPVPGRTELILLSWFIVCCECFIHIFSSDGVFYCSAHQHCVVSVSCCTMFGILGDHGPLAPLNLPLFECHAHLQRHSAVHQWIAAALHKLSVNLWSPAAIHWSA